MMEKGNLWMGVLGGLIFTILGAFLWQIITVMTGYFVGLVAIVSGGIAGLGFGLLFKKDDSFTLHVMGGAFGYASIIIGFYLIFISSITDYVPVYGWTTFVPADIMSFTEFMTTSLGDSAFNIFAIIIGIIAGSKAAVYAARGRMKKQ